MINCSTALSFFFGAHVTTLPRLTAVTPLMIRSLRVSVPVLSKQQMLILPALGILKGSVQKIYFLIRVKME